VLKAGELDRPLLTSSSLRVLLSARHKSDFGVECRTALVTYLAGAVSDVRMLHGLKQDCSEDITK
jgi:hypothetical protein